MKEQLAGVFPADVPGIVKATAIRKWCFQQQLGDSANLTYYVNGRPASLLDVYDGLNNGGLSRISFEWEQDAHLTSGYIEFARRRFHHLLYTTTNAYFDGYHASFFGTKRIAIAHFASYGEPPYPVQLKNVLSVAAIGFVLLGNICLVYASYYIVEHLAGRVLGLFRHAVTALCLGAIIRP